MNKTTICNHTTSTNLSCATHPSFQPNPAGYAQFFEVAFGSSIYMSVVAFITVVANSLLLLVFYVDPLKTFRDPTSCFLIGLAFVDLITGLVQEPIFASCFILGYLGHQATHHCLALLRCAQILSLVTMNASFIIVLVFTATQLIVVAYPIKFGSQVTNKKILITILVIYGYTITFGLLNLIKLPDPETFQKVDLFLHSFLMVYLSIFCYILLYRAFRRKMASLMPLRSKMVFHGNLQRTTCVERKFIMVNFFLIFLVFFCTQPSAILGLYTHYWLGTDDPGILIPNLMVDNILYLKFMLDPFVYAWRLPKYRRALKMVLCCGSRQEQPAAARGTIKFPEAIVALNLINISE